MKQQCVAAAPSFIDDGFCDLGTNTDGDYEHNNEACAWDGGDCCPETCDTSLYDCSAFMTCTDPERYNRLFVKSYCNSMLP